MYIYIYIYYILRLMLIKIRIINQNLRWRPSSNLALAGTSSMALMIIPLSHSSRWDFPY